MSNIKKNFIYNVAYQILALIIPFITIPYISRILKPAGLGVYSYTYTIAYYFMTFALLGINNYGNRTIAKSRENKKKLSKNFWSIYLIQIVSTIIMIALYNIYIFIFEKEHLYYCLLQELWVVSAGLDINWFFQGMENFKLTVTRNSIIKISSIVFIFAFVKTENDIWKYILIMTLSTILSEIILFKFLLRYVEFEKITKQDVLPKIRPILILFVPVIAVMIYKVMDKIMIGKIIGTTEVAYYENAEKIINIPISIVNALGMVMLPSTSNLIAKGEEKLVKEYFYKTIRFIMSLIIPIIVGIICISNDFVELYLGNDFMRTSDILKILIVSVLFSSIANVIRTQYLIPKERDKEYIISVTAGAIVNFVLNYYFIKMNGAIGASVSTVIAEFLVMFIQILFIKNEFNFKSSFKSFIKYLLCSITIIIGCIILEKISNELLKLVLKILVSSTMYFWVLFIIKDEFVNIVINKIKKLYLCKKV